MPKEKTNIDYLREFIKDNDEAIEFLDAIENEITSLKDGVKNLETENNSCNSEINELMMEVEELRQPDFETIDCGIGTIEWRADNLKLQQIMEDFAEKQESILFR